MSLNSITLASGKRYIPEASTPPPGTFTLPDGVPLPASDRPLWQVRGDEELAEHNYMSRSAAPDWGYLIQTPSVFRFEDKWFNVTRRNPTDYKVDISPLDAEIRRLNEYHPQKMARLYSTGTALFNSGWPKQGYLVMSGNVLREIEVIDGLLKFSTITPQTDVSDITRETHPWFVMRWDLVTYDKLEGGQIITKHVIDKTGEIYWFLCSAAGYGYIPLKWVRRVQ
jgi:hypothetical protein